MVSPCVVRGNKKVLTYCNLKSNVEVELPQNYEPQQQMLIKQKEIAIKSEKTLLQDSF